MDAASYAIDIATRMTGLESTSAELDALTTQLSGAGKGAEHFQEAMRAVTADLDGARLAGRAAAEALALGTDEYRSLEAAAAQAAKAAENAARMIAVREGTAAKALEAASAVEAYAGKLEALKAAASATGGSDDAANAALLAGMAKYSKLEAASTKAARAAAKAANAASGVVPDDLTAEAAKAKAAVDAYAVTLQKLEDAATGATSKEKKLGDTLANVKKLAGHVDKSLSGQSEGLAKMQGALSAMGGPLGSLGSRLVAPIKGFADLSQGMGAANAAALAGVVGFAAVTVAVVAITAAVVAGTVAIASWAVRLGDARRSADLTRAAAEAMTPELAALRGEIDSISNDTGQSVTALASLEQSLRSAKVSAEDMPEALRAAAMAETALGSGGSAKFIAGIQAGKQSVQALAAATQKSLGGIVAAQMRGLDAQSTKLKANFNGLFAGLNIAPALSGMQILVGLFDRTSASGQTMTLFFETIFNPLVAQAENAGYAIEAFVLGFEKAALQAYIGAKPMLEMLGFESPALADTLDLVAKAGEYFFTAAVALAVPLVALVGVFAVVAAAAEALVLVGLSPLIAGFYLFKTIGPVVVGAANAVIGAIKNLWATVTSLIPPVSQWYSIGSNIVLGIARGIAGQAGSVLSAIGGVVSGAIASAKRLLGIASPSKVFAGIGAFTGEGFAGGLEREAVGVHAAMSEMVEPPQSVLSKADALGGMIDMPASALSSMPALAMSTSASSGQAKSDAPSAPKGSRGSGMDLSGASFNFYGVKDAEDAVTRFGEMLTRVLEGDALSLGDAVAA